EIAWAEGVCDNHHRVARSHYGRCQSCGRYPRVDLAHLEAGVQGGEAGILDRLQVQGVDNVRLLNRALDRANTLTGSEITEFGDRRARRHHERVVPEIVAVGEGDGAPPRIGGFDV